MLHLPGAAQDDSAYTLVAVIEHMGSTNAGHYVTYARENGTGDWLLFDDSTVQPVGCRVRDVQLKIRLLIIHLHC